MRRAELVNFESTDGRGFSRPSGGAPAKKVKFNTRRPARPPARPCARTPARLPAPPAIVLWLA